MVIIFSALIFLQLARLLRGQFCASKITMGSSSKSIRPVEETFLTGLSTALQFWRSRRCIESHRRRLCSCQIPMASATSTTLR